MATLDEQIEQTCFALSVMLGIHDLADNEDMLILIKRYANVYSQTQLDRVVQDLALNGHHSASVAVSERIHYIAELMP